MILLDLSQVMISNIMIQISTRVSNGIVDEQLIRHMVLNSIRLYRKKFYSEYGELVICCDDRNCWRRDYYPHYKSNRKKDREESALDWNAIFEAMSNVRQELREHMPYKHLQIDRAEADDVIAALCHRYGEITRNGNEKILILSGDKDFAQLQKYVNVYQYSPVMKKDIIVDNPERFLREHIMSGDRGDGVPNFLSADDTFVEGKRQNQLSRKKLQDWCVMKPEDFCDDAMLRGYKRNEMMINLDLIPIELQNEIIMTYENQIPARRSNIMNYFMDKRLRNLTENIGDF